MREFEEAAGEIYGVAYKVAYRMLGSRPDAEEVAQEVAARALVRWSRVEPYADAWAGRVASNLVLDRVRRSRFRMPWTDRVDRPTDSERVELVAALRRLTGRQREVVVLRYLADLPEEVVAERLGCSPVTVKQHASRGLAALRHDAQLAVERGR